jgi:hypothetical protein
MPNCPNCGREVQGQHNVWVWCKPRWCRKWCRKAGAIAPAFFLSHVLSANRRFSLASSTGFEPATF